MTAKDAEALLLNAFLELAGPPLPSDFEELFAFHLSLQKSPSEAYRAASYASTGDYEERALALSKRPEILRRMGEFEKAREIQAIQYGSALKARGELKKRLGREPTFEELRLASIEGDANGK